MLSPRAAALDCLALALVTIAGAWIFQMAGYAPCELCLLQRWPYYIGVPLAALAVLATRLSPGRLATLCFGLLALLFLGSAIFGAYHAGVEWGFWPGPTGCTGAIRPNGNVGDLLKQIENTRIVRCDEVAIRIFGLSLAGWNAIVSLVIAAVAWGGMQASRGAQ